MTDSGLRRVGWGILAAGHIASVFAEDLALLPDEADRVAVGSRSQAKAEQFARTYGFARAYGSYAELVEDPDVDVVYIASTTNDHVHSAELCLSAGKAVLVEKPLTATPAETEAVIALASRSGLFLMEAVWSRTNPLLRRAAQLVGSGELGPVRHLTASFGFRFSGEPTHRLLDPAQGGGGILDLGLYPVHAAQLLLGEPDEVVASGDLAATGVDVHAAALLSYRAVGSRPAATAALLCSLEAAMPSRLEVFCSDGSIGFDNFIRPEEMHLWRGSDRSRPPEVLLTQLPGHGYTLEAQEVMRCIRSGVQESPLVPWADTVAASRTMERWRAGLPSMAGAV